ncbi:hypothetical protein G7Y89_g7922 [Cudoniella acicularis]|uniref:Uncharacterized protein n=1 Tax=Cudoniella acicularis TaxID=354080 RepID=A0A8H4RHL1_9HELO|nr:hypothetical protein G7Y89_g7922 [Cudoniella acicularis]
MYDYKKGNKIKERLIECLESTKDSTGEFSYHEKLPNAPNPGLHIRGVGTIGFSLFTPKDSVFGFVDIFLPSKHEGDEIVMKHGPEKQTYNTSSFWGYDCSYLAWYSDATTSWPALKSGYRLVIRYRLEHTTRLCNIDSAAALGGQTTRFRKIFSSWMCSDRRFSYVAFRLHGDQLCLQDMKERDRNTLTHLQEAATAEDFCVYLTTATLTKYGAIDERCREDYDKISSTIILIQITDVNGKEHFKGLTRKISEKVFLDVSPFSGIEPYEKDHDCGSLLIIKSRLHFYDSTLTRAYFISPSSRWEQFCSEYIPTMDLGYFDPIDDKLLHVSVILDDKDLFRRMLPIGVLSRYYLNIIDIMIRRHGLPWMQESLNSALSKITNFASRYEAIDRFGSYISAFGWAKTQYRLVVDSVGTSKLTSPSDVERLFHLAKNMNGPALEKSILPTLRKNADYMDTVIALLRCAFESNNIARLTIRQIISVSMKWLTLEPPGAKGFLANKHRRDVATLLYDLFKRNQVKNAVMGIGEIPLKMILGEQYLTVVHLKFNPPQEFFSPNLVLAETYATQSNTSIEKPLFAGFGTQPSNIVDLTQDLSREGSPAFETMSSA